MNLKELKEELDRDVKTIVSTDFKVEVTNTVFVPTIETDGITYPDLDDEEMRAKKIKTCTLYIDMRKSTNLNLVHHPETITKLYGAFMRSMVKAAQQYKGHVRNIIGDRVMVVFDEENCFTNAVHTAILLNSVGKYIINKHFSNNEVIFGIGIDYGEMLVSKGGIRKNGENNAPYKSLVWLGRPANVASKLTDLAHKNVDIEKKTTEDSLDVMTWYEIEGMEYETYFSEMTYSEFYKEEVKRYPEIKFRIAEGEKPYFVYHSEVINKIYTPATANSRKLEKINTPPILMTEEVFKSYKQANENDKSIKESYWRLQDENLYKGYRIYGGDVYYTDIKN